MLDSGWEHTPGLASFRARAAEILDDTFGPAAHRPPVIAWKDPRLSLLLPFWRTVTPIATTIVVVRDPVEVAASLGVRKYQVGSSQAASLWLRYLYAAIADDPGHLLVNHSDIFDDLPGTVGRLAAHLGLPTPDAAVEAAVRDHLDTGLRHHDAAQASADLANPLLDFASAIWNDGAVDVGLVPPDRRRSPRPGLAPAADRRRAARPGPGRRGCRARDVAQDEPAGRDARGAARGRRRSAEQSTAFDRSERLGLAPVRVPEREVAPDHLLELRRRRRRRTPTARGVRRA